MKFNRNVDVRSVEFENGMTITFSNFMASQLAGNGCLNMQREILQSLELIFDTQRLSAVERESIIADLSY
jgi:hypothetical protein